MQNDAFAASMQQTWHDLLFAHWPVPPEMLNRLLPPALTVDTWEGEAWVAVVPFHMSGIRFWGLPPLPLTHAFAELNVRTYVTYQGVPGVWFFSLDASNWLAVEAARAWFHLPYFYAGMVFRQEKDTLYYASQRTDRRANPGMFAGSYRPISPPFRTEPDTLEYWLTERYALYAANRHGQLYRARIQHDPWPLQLAEADIRLNSVAASHGIHLPDTQPLLHFSKRLDVLAQTLENVH